MTLADLLDVIIRSEGAIFRTLTPSRISRSTASQSIWPRLNVDAIIQLID